MLCSTTEDVYIQILRSRTRLSFASMELFEGASLSTVNVMQAESGLPISVGCFSMHAISDSAGII